MHIFLATWMEDGGGITLTSDLVEKYVQNGIYISQGGKGENKKRGTI